MTSQAERPPLEHVLEDLSLEDLWERRLDTIEQLQALQRERGFMDQELARRFEAQGEDATQLAGDGLLVRIKREPRYDFDLQVLRDCAISGLISWEEYQGLVKTVEQVDKRVFNELVKRGGELKGRLESALTTRWGSPTFEAKPR